MACVTVTAVEAVAITAAAQIIAHHAKKTLASPVLAGNSTAVEKANKRLEASQKLMWLAKLLLGGSLLLIFEHVWHGEIQPFFPFLTAAATPQTTQVMLHEMATVGVTMSVLVTAVWAVMVVFSKAVEKKAAGELVKETSAA